MQHAVTPAPTREPKSVPRGPKSVPLAPESVPHASHRTARRISHAQHEYRGLRVYRTAHSCIASMSVPDSAQAVRSRVRMC
eukprot:3645488-Rhodomonas_salina.1